MATRPGAYTPLYWRNDRLVLLDQTLLPSEELYLETSDYRVAADAIRQLKVRGAPSIGIAGAYAAALGALELAETEPQRFITGMQGVIDFIAATRPTARNLFFALERMKKVLDSGGTAGALKKALVAESVAIHGEESESTRRLSLHGAGIIKNGWTILTHCNAGPLAAPDYGTALGVIIMAHRQGKEIRVMADETRPLLQGARLTAWELQKAGIPVTLITDNMAGYFMQKGGIDCVITGADRIAANGDAANKIGTYSVAVLAAEHGIPFFIAAPSSTFDLPLDTGDDIPIEERSPEEVTCLHGVAIAPAGIPAANPAFDVTPARFITAIITENGIYRPPFAFRNH